MNRILNKEYLYQLLPLQLQNFLITLYNIKSYRERYGGKYTYYRQLFKNNNNLSLAELQNIQQERFSRFVTTAVQYSNFYSKLYDGYLYADKQINIKELPIINKETLRNYIKEVYTIDKSRGIVSKTGGTTGKSLEVLFTSDNMQERFAMLDNFRSKFGYELGKKTAWFSGKKLLTPKDIHKNRFWKTDFYYKVRYYSTFHIKEDYLKYYIQNLLNFKPEYLVGFPSSIYEIARYGLDHKIEFPTGIVKAIFPTAETVTLETRNTLKLFFKADVFDQYASSEGAPFIFECQNHNLHLEFQSGLFEVLDNNNEYSNVGKLIVTSFTTEGTPLIRYDIGDDVELSEDVCNCGNNNPLVKQILGRIDDYVYSPENGKINLGNVSNTLKDVKGIIKFQVLQNELNKLEILQVIDKKLYSKDVEEKFISNWRDRVGKRMEIELKIVEEIPLENSGKFRIVKNNIKHFIVS